MKRLDLPTFKDYQNQVYMYNQIISNAILKLEHVRH